MSISSSQFGDKAPEVELPLSLSSSTTGSAAGATAWRTRGLAGGRPMSLSKRTLGTTYKFDDDAASNLPKSDKGAGRNE
jgi:hypothetical protein